MSRKKKLPEDIVGSKLQLQQRNAVPGESYEKIILADETSNNGSFDKSTHEIDLTNQKKESDATDQKNTDQIVQNNEAELTNQNQVTDLTEQIKDTNLTEQNEDADIIEQKEGPDLSDRQNTEADHTQEEPPKIKVKYIYKALRLLFTLGFIIFLILFINEVWIQPYRLKKVNQKARELYHSDIIKKIPPPDTKEPEEKAEEQEESVETIAEPEEPPAPTPDPNRDAMGRLIKFGKLLEVNEDVKGWIRIDNVNGENDTKIDYVVVQSDYDDPEYYLTRDWASKEYLKAGSLFLDVKSSVESNTKNLVIHGHNMSSSDDMFHYLINYKEKDFLEEHPVISFDSIYQEGLWKIFSVFITPGGNKKGDFFDFTKSYFISDKEFLEFIYQFRIRSLFHFNDVDINESDQILTLSTCSYELDDYRIIVAARKVREGEDPTVDPDQIVKNKKPLYPKSYYKHYGGKAPDILSFDAALQDGLISWYNPMDR